MLLTLAIKNIALIEELEVDFADNLNILSGETGAGKSIILNSIVLLIGQKFDAGLIRNGEDFAEVSGVFYIDNHETKIFLETLGIELDDDNLLLLHRRFSVKDKSFVRVNGKISTLKIIKELGKFLVDIHGQHEHQLLLDPSKHISYLDRFCLDKLNDYKENLFALFGNYRKLKEKVSSLKMDEKDKLTKLDILDFQINEIESANLKIGEEEDLFGRKKRLLSLEKLINNSKKCVNLLYNGESDDSALDKINIAVELLEDISKVDDIYYDLSERLTSVKSELVDIIYEVNDYSDNLEQEDFDIDEIEKRLNTIFLLKRKYGNSIEEIIAHLDEITIERDLISNNDEEILKLEKELKEILSQSKAVCEKISAVRKAEGQKLENKIIDNLQDLGMQNVQFKIAITKKDTFNEDGFDKVEFLISPNLGEDLKPLQDIASGGEMSRIILAIKSILAKYDNIGTFIFDEIDTGVSGRTAQKVAEKLKVISKEHQIICITHLPQIAAMADKHFLIEKFSEDFKTKTILKELPIEEKVNEIARLIGGVEITEKTLVAAHEMLTLANRPVRKLE